MKILYFLIILGLSIVTLQAFAIDQEFSSTPADAGTFSYTDNTLQTQFTIPVVVAIIAIVAGIGIYFGARSK